MACYGTIQAGFAHWYIISFRGVGRSFFFQTLCVWWIWCYKRKQQYGTYTYIGVSKSSGYINSQWSGKNCFGHTMCQKHSKDVLEGTVAIKQVGLWYVCSWILPRNAGERPSQATPNRISSFYVGRCHHQDFHTFEPPNLKASLSTCMLPG